ncbi:MAG: bifunctional folylpolyglutamate synthase/dihydrofolate synthase [Chloroflexota bacterium]|nr:bifunctional folylpolyglutamate synthase/dihydrofolate synthase [Chloroflexota bacterium]MDE2942002.1 bifunctional folylpolyglutamate synthase/dihydrofolate synthase [Chloroflexota bacterium]MDE3267100.1 bifunctional folylpolyglutamate synthase/dihydrofolate synthase [Chloroflexota bacterium]
MRYAEAIERIMGMVDYERPATIPGGRARYDLERIGALLERLSSPHLGVPTVHVAGTKGKGSTTAMVASILDAAGFSTGLFTSPHLHTFRERIRVGGRPIPEDEFAGLVETLWPAVEEMRRAGHGRVTVFELLTAMAFRCFRERGVDAQVIEVGLGGRLDSTNVVQPMACGITALGLDHTEVLGDTLAEIAMEKAGIIKSGVPVVCSPQRPEALEVVRKACEAQECSLIMAGEDVRWSPESATLDGQVFTLETPRRTYRLAIPLLGEHQMENAAVAVGLVEALAEGGIDVGREAIEEGLRRVEWSCRLEVLRREPLVIADGAHNPHSAARLAEAMRSLVPGRRLTLVVGVSRNKDVDGVAYELSRLSPAEVLATRSRHPRSAEPALLAREFERYGALSRTAASVADAVDEAVALASEGDVILVTGSLFVAAEAREHALGIEPELYPVFDTLAAPAPRGM